MLSSRVFRLVRADRFPRREGVTERAVALVFLARFADELLFGAWDVLAPTWRREFGLSLVQLALLVQVLEWVAAVVEPVAATLIDLRSRRWLLAGGAAGIGAALVVTGLAPGYWALMAAAVLFGLASGALAQTADVVLVESFPEGATRAFGRATMLDTVGALLGPACVAAATFLGVSWRVVAVALGGWALLYARTMAVTSFPLPPGGHEGPGLLRQAVANVRAAMTEPAAREWLGFMWWFTLFESAFLLKWVWLAEEVGLGQAGVAVYAVAEQVVGLAALGWLDQRLDRRDPLTVLRWACGALVVLPVAWVTAPAPLGTVAVGVPLAVAMAVVWPICRPAALAAAPGRAGAVTAVTALFAAVPLALLEARLAEVVGLGPALAAPASLAALCMVGHLRRRVPERR